MKKAKPVSNHIKALCQKKGISSVALAKKIGTSAPHMSRLINGQTPLTHEWLLKISAALKVPTSQIINVGIEKNFAEECDDTLLGSIMGWLLEASEEFDIELSRQELTRLTGFIYKQSVQKRLNLDEARYLASASVQIKQILA